MELIEIFWKKLICGVAGYLRCRLPHLSGDITRNTVPELLRIDLVATDVGKLLHHLLVVIEIVLELLPVLLQELEAYPLDVGRFHSSHRYPVRMIFRNDRGAGIGLALF